MRVKICGITNLEDALAAVDSGADALGFVFFPASPRHISPDEATAIIRRLPPFVQTVGLFVNDDLETVNATADRCGLDMVQLHGDEPPDFCGGVRRRVIKAFRVQDASTLDTIGTYRVSACLLDAWSPLARGGTGETFNWDIAAQAVRDGRRIILAGGLTPDNVADAVRQVRPYAVDVSSGVEAAPGKKDPMAVRMFITSARQTLAVTNAGRL